MAASKATARPIEAPQAPEVSTRTIAVPGIEPVPIGSEGHLVWRSLRDAWLAHRTVADQALHVKGARAWNASRYAPVFVADVDGGPFLSFHRH